MDCVSWQLILSLKKIYVFLWFWFMLLAGFTAVHLILRFVSIASPQFRFSYLKKRASSSENRTLKFILRKCEYGDWWLLMQLSKTYHPLVFKDFLEDLEKKLKLKDDVRLESLSQEK